MSQLSIFKCMMIVMISTFVISKVHALCPCCFDCGGEEEGGDTSGDNNGASSTGSGNTHADEAAATKKAEEEANEKMKEEALQEAMKKQTEADMKKKAEEDSCLFVCNRGDTIQYPGGIQARKLGQAPILVILTPRAVLSSHQHRTLVFLY